MRVALLALSLVSLTGCDTDRSRDDALLHAEPTCLRDRVGERVTIRGSLELDGKLGPVLVHDGGYVVFEGASQGWTDDHALLLHHRVEVTAIIGFSYAPTHYVSKDGSFGCPEQSYFFVPAWTAGIRRVDE